MKTKYILATLLLVMSFASCKKFLETTPTDFLSPDAYFVTQDQLEFARVGVYHTLEDSRLYGNAALYLLGWWGDEAYMRVSSLPSGPFNYNYGPGDTYNSRLWTVLYDGINRANIVLANIDKNPEINQAYRDKVRGEVLFLRGYYYFLLVQYYGGVPLKTAPTFSVTDVSSARASISDTYNQILADMETAEPLVPDIATLGYGGAISKSAVRGLLARVNLFMAGQPLNDQSRYAEASKWAKKVIDDGTHSLNPSYPQVFMNLAGDKYDIKESIWEAEFWGNLQGTYKETGVNGWANGPVSAQANLVNGPANGYLCITAKFYNVFEPGDNRKWFDIAHYSIPGANPPNGAKTLLALPSTEAAKYNLYPAKFRREYETYAPKEKNSTPENVPLLRYADILLMYAEAENGANGGPTPQAIDAVNQVRRRAWSTGVKSIKITSGGTGYTSVPTITFVGGGGSGATAKATISGGKITAITLNRDSSGVRYYQEGTYTSAPTIVISGGGGTGATAVATVYSLSDADLTASQTSSQDAFLSVIQDERLRELNCENLRKSDLIRWGIFARVHQEMGNQIKLDAPGAFFINNFTNVTAPRDLLSPIPTIEMNTNTLMTQNPGW